MALGRKIIRQMAAAGKGGLRRLSAGRSGGRVTAQSFNRASQGSGIAPQPYKPNHGGRVTVRPAQIHPIVQKHGGNIIFSVYSLVCLDYALGGELQADVINKIKGYGEGLKNLVVRKEVSRPPPPAEVNTAEVELIREWGAEFEQAEFEQNRKWGTPFKA